MACPGVAGQTRFHRLDICICTIDKDLVTLIQCALTHSVLLLIAHSMNPFLYCSDHILLLFVTSSYSSSAAAMQYVCSAFPCAFSQYILSSPFLKTLIQACC